MRRLALFGSALAAALALAAPAAHAAEAGRAAFDATTLDISVSGEVKAAPDEAIITLGVQTQAKTAAEALRQNRERMASALAAVKAQGIAAKDIQTSNLNLSAQYVYEQGQPQRLTGYQASNDVTVTVHEIAKLGATVDAVTAAGINQINGISFGIKDPRASEDQARREAVKALQARAALYADASGMRIGRLVNLSEGGGYQPQPIAPRVFAMAKAAAPTPVEPGELTVRVQVSAVYELVK